MRKTENSRGFVALAYLTREEPPDGAVNAFKRGLDLGLKNGVSDKLLQIKACFSPLALAPMLR